MRCPHCHSQTQDGDRFCVQCGARLTPAKSLCPSCGSVLKTGDAFCQGCGQPVEKASESEALLDHQQVRAMAAGWECNHLSPLAALSGFQEENDELASQTPAELLAFTEGMLSALLRPEKVLYLAAFGREKYYQSILLVRQGACYGWQDENGQVHISRLHSSPHAFLARIQARLAERISDGHEPLLMLKRGHLEILRDLASQEEALAQMGLEPAFATKTQLEAFRPQGHALDEGLRAMSNAGLIKLLDGDNTLIFLAEKGSRVVSLLERHDFHYNLMVMRLGASEMANLNFLAQGERLYLLTNPQNGEDVLLRRLDRDALKSLIEWAWASVVYFESPETALARGTSGQPES